MKKALAMIAVAAMCGGGCTRAVSFPTPLSEAQGAWTQVMQACAQRLQQPNSLPCGVETPAPITASVNVNTDPKQALGVLKQAADAVGGVVEPIWPLLVAP